MCIYIKDDDEQCGMSNHEGLWCRHHEDSRQAQAFAQAASAAQSGSSASEMETVCDNCEAPLRRRERLTEHPNQTRRMVFEAYVECDCHEFVLGSTSVRERNLPSGWSS